MRFRFLIVLLVAVSFSTLAACGGSGDEEENRRLTEQVAALTDTNDTLASERAELQAQVETLADQVATLTESMDASAAEKAELLMQVETLAEGVAALTDTNDALTSQKVELDAQVETLAEQVAALTDANDALSSENAELRAQAETLAEQVATLTDGSDALASDKAELQEHIETLSEQVATLSEQVTTLTAANDAADSEKAELQAQVERLTDQVVTLTDTNDALASEKAELQAQVETLTGEVETLTEQRDEALAAPEDTPAVAGTSRPEPTAARQVISGSGDDVVPVDLQPGLTWIEASHSGVANFALWLRAETDELLINEIGPYEGTVVASVGGGSFLLDIEADGAWELAVREPRNPSPLEIGAYVCTGRDLLQYWPTPPAAIDSSLDWSPMELEEPISVDAKFFLCGGDAPTGFVQVSGQFLTILAEHRGSENFVVWLYHESGDVIDLVVNVIGDYSGTNFVRVTPGEVYFLRVEADGGWLVTFNELDAS